MNEILVNLDNISSANIGKIDDCLKNNHHINSYEIIPENNSIVIRMKYDFEMPYVSRTLAKHGYKIIAATLQRKETSIPFLEALTCKDAIDQEILRENANFDLEEFFTNQLEGAICIITKNRTIFANALINHYTALNYIYNFLYNNSDQIKNYCVPSENVFWQEAGVAFGNIVIQLCSNVSSTVWLPEEITPYQQSELNKILNQINIIRQKHNIPIDIEIGRPSEFKKEPVGSETLQSNSKTL